jgi:hypothetical protein
VRDGLESPVENPVTLADGGGGINVERRPKSLRQLAQRNPLTMKLAILVDEPWRPGEQNRRFR